MLKKYRSRIDRIDEQVIRLLARRKRIVKRIQEYKKEKKIKPRDPGREKEIISEKRKLARQLGVNPGLAAALLKKIIKKNK